MRSSRRNTEFRDAMNAVYENAFLEELDWSCGDLSVERPVAAYLILHELITGLGEFTLNAGCSLPPEFDRFARGDVLTFLRRTAGD